MPTANRYLSYSCTSSAFFVVLIPLVAAIYVRPPPLIMVFTTRPVITVTHGVAASSHYLASVEGLQVLREGGGVVDAGTTMWFLLSLLNPHLIGVTGEVPILLYMADDERVLAVNGQGPAPMAATIQWFKEHGYPLIPEDGFTPAVVPGAFHAWMRTMDRS